MGILNRPIEQNGGGSYYKTYDKIDFDTFMEGIGHVDYDISGKTLYMMSKVVSQSKLREMGFSITRSKDKADVIVLEDIRSTGSVSYKKVNYQFCNSDGVEELIVELDADQSKGYKYIFVDQLYKYLYKYTGDFELYKSIDDLLRTGTSDNQKMAMEFMSNANWGDNEIYLQELFNRYWHNGIRGNSYKNSISFQGFLSSLDFNYESVYMRDADAYRALCRNEEHHNWVFTRFEQEFKNELDILVKKHKIKLDEIKFSIDKSIF